MVLKDEANAPKSMQQLRALKHRNDQKNNSYSGNKVADEVLEVLMLNENDFMHTKGQIPSIILYNKEQMKDFKKCITNNDEPRVGIDRTFNLGSFYVTWFVYKNNRVVRKESNDHPIFLGPIFLHKEARFDKYHYFLSHINAGLSSQIESVDVILPPSIQIGSNEEKSLTKAIDTVFPDAKRSLCTKHLKDNVSAYLRNKIRVKTKERVHIMDSIVGEEGVLNSKDIFEFDERCAKITTLPDASRQEFFNYFHNILQPKLKLNFSNLEPSGLNSASKWTNNNAESIHNLMIIDVNWKPQSTPALIKVLSDMVKLQMLDLQRSLYNTGNFRFHGVNRKFCIREDIFRSKTVEDQTKYFLNFIKSSLSKPPHITSTDGQYSVPKKTKEAAKKPAQKKRPVNAKTSKRH